ncbi:MAG: RNA polymerase sigma factor [Longimicrobiaceae bacterium]
MATQTDGEIVRLVLSGEREAYGVLVARYQAVLYRHAVGMVRSPDTAEDMVQESFVRGFRELRRCREPDRFGSWIFRVLRNRCLDYLKDKRRRNVSLEEELTATANPPAAEGVLERERIHRALHNLPPDQREAFLLKHVEGYGYQEMSGLLGASVSALKMRVMRAREALREALSE